MKRSTTFFFLFLTERIKNRRQDVFTESVVIGYLQVDWPRTKDFTWDELNGKLKQAEILPKAAKPFENKSFRHVLYFPTHLCVHSSQFCLMIGSEEDWFDLINIKGVFNSPSLQPAFLLPDLLASHFCNNWLSWLGLSYQAGSTTDHHSLLPTQHVEISKHNEGKANWGNFE